MLSSVLTAWSMLQMSCIAGSSEFYDRMGRGQEWEEDNISNRREPMRHPRRGRSDFQF